MRDDTSSIDKWRKHASEKVSYKKPDFGIGQGQFGGLKQVAQNMGMKRNGNELLGGSNALLNRKKR